MSSAAGSAPGPSDGDWADWRALVGRAGEDAPLSALHRMNLGGPAPAGLVAAPKELRPADPHAGARILAGDWRFDGPRARVSAPPDRAPWGPPFPTPHFADRVHRLDWLRDVAAQGPEGQRRGRSLLMSWIDTFGKWDAFAWRVGATADRVINILSAGPWLLGGLEEADRLEALGLMGRQVRHIRQRLEETPDPESRLRGAVALALAGAALADQADVLTEGLAALERECADQMLADGGHASRSAEALAGMLIDVHLVEDLLLRVGRQAPPFLSRHQSRMASMLGFLTLDDGDLLVGHGGGRRHGLAAAALAAHGETRSRFSFARLTGYQRVQAEELVLYFDTAPPTPTTQGGWVHASALALTICDGPDRILTSCGSHAALDPRVRDAARRTPAHATLTLDNLDSAQFVIDPNTDVLAADGPPGLSARRIEENDQFLLEGQHAAWRSTHGLIHRRRVYIAKNGARVTGEDALYRPASEAAIQSPAAPFALRFPLHPDVEAHAPAGDNRTVYLGLPARRRVWRFRSEAPVRVIESPYWGDAGERRTHQLVIEALADANSDGSSPPNRVRWALSRVEPGV